MSAKLAERGHRRRGPGRWWLLDPDQVPDQLTVEILRGIARGGSNPEVAVSCHVSVRTLCRKLAEVRDLWQVETTIEAVVIAARFELV